MLTKSKVASSFVCRTSEVSVIGDTLKIDQTNVTVNIDDNPFETLEPPELHIEDVEDEIKLLRKK